MFKETKGLAGDPNQIKNQIELHRITSDAQIDRTESCFADRSRQTREQYRKSTERAAKTASKWF